MDEKLYYVLKNKEERELMAYYCACITLIDTQKVASDKLLENVEEASAEYFQVLAESIKQLKEKRSAVEKRFNEIYNFENRAAMKAWISIQYEILKMDSAWKRLVKEKIKELSVK